MHSGDNRIAERSFLFAILVLLLPTQAYASDFGMIPVGLSLMAAAGIGVIQMLVVIPGIAFKRFRARNWLITSYVTSVIALLIFIGGLCLMFSRYSVRSREYREVALLLLGVPAVLAFNVCAPTIQYFKIRRNDRSVGICYLYLFLSVVLLAMTLQLSIPYMKNDLLQALFSFIGPISVLVSSILLLRSPQSGAKWTNTRWGLLTGGSLFVIMQILVISMRYQEILEDGVAYWMYVNMPGIILGIPLLLVGGICGWIVDRIKNGRSKTRPEATP